MAERLLLPTLDGYQTRWLRNDLVAGIAAGAVVIPQAMAYATIANLPVEVGLYTCILPLLVYALLGGSRAMSVTTTSTIATLTATTMVTAGVADSPAELVTLTLLVGVILVIARLAKLGSLVENINEATMVGLKVGLGATVALGQVPKLLGVQTNVSGHGFFHTLVATIEAVPQTNPATLALSTATIATLILLARVAPRVPGQLVVVAGGIMIAALTTVGIDVVGEVPTGFAAPLLPAVDHIPELVPGALAIAMMAFLESASVARSIRRRDEPQIDSNRELFATGAANVVGSFFGTLPSAGGFSQSAVNQRAGARTQLASIVTATLAILVALFLAPILANLPEATLASMVIVAVVGLIDVRGVVRFWRASRVEFWICIITAAIGLAAGLLPAVAAGVVLTLGLVLHAINQPRFSSTIEGDTLTVRLDASLYTANVRGTRQAIDDILDTNAHVTRLVLDVTAVTATSLTVLDALADFDHELSARAIQFDIVGLAGAPLVMAQKTVWWQSRTATPPAR